MNENWIEVSEKKEIKKLKRNDARGVLYLRIAWLSVFTLYVLRIVNSIYIWKEYTAISCIVFDVVGKLFNTLGLFIFFQEPKNLRNVIVDLYEGPMVMKDIEVCFSTKESPVRKGDSFSFYTVLYDKFGSKIDEIRIPEDVYESCISCTSDVVYYKNSGVVVKHRRHGQ